jgi:hypothetical protein
MPEAMAICGKNHINNNFWTNRDPIAILLIANVAVGARSE